MCPICKNTTVVPEEGVSGFPTHFMANTLQETLDLEKLKVGLTREDEYQWYLKKECLVSLLISWPILYKKHTT